MGFIADRRRLAAMFGRGSRDTPPDSKMQIVLPVRHIKEEGWPV